MPLSVYDSTVGPFETLLTAFTGILDKAAAHAVEAKFDPAIYLTLRVRPDMLAFPKQVQIFCDHAKFVAARLSGVEAPRFEDDETSLDDLKGRIAKTLAFVRSVDRTALEAGADREINFNLAGKKAKMIGRDYFLHFALPNFYFHLTTAYDLLRDAGVNLGKRDFLGAVPRIQLD